MLALLGSLLVFVGLVGLVLPALPGMPLIVAGIARLPGPTGSPASASRRWWPSWRSGLWARSWTTRPVCWVPGAPAPRVGGSRVRCWAWSPALPFGLLGLVIGPGAWRRGAGVLPGQEPAALRHGRGGRAGGLRPWDGVEVRRRHDHDRPGDPGLFLVSAACGADPVPLQQRREGVERDRLHGAAVACHRGRRQQGIVDGLLGGLEGRLEEG